MVRHFQRVSWLLGLAFTSAGAFAAEPDAPLANIAEQSSEPAPAGGEAAQASAPISAIWKRHQHTVFYYSRNTLYTCDGMRDKAKRILLEFGVRADARVRVSGCGIGGNAVTGRAWLELNFHAPAPLDRDAAAQGETDSEVQFGARFEELLFKPQRPSFMDEAECELVEALMPVLSSALNIPREDYRLRCPMGGFAKGRYEIKTRVLKAVPGTAQRVADYVPKGSTPSMPRGVERRELVYLSQGGLKLEATHYAPRGPGPFPLAIFVHGGNWVLGDRSAAAYAAPLLAARGIGVLAIDFRQPPQAAYPASLIDINYAIRWAKRNAGQLGTRADWIGLYGEASGAHQAVLAALLPEDEQYASRTMGGEADGGAQVAFVVSCWGVLDPLEHMQSARERGEPTLLAAYERYFAAGATDLQAANPRGVLARGEQHVTPPLLLVHGKADRQVDYHASERFAEDYRRAGGQSELALFEGEDHGFISVELDESAEAAIERIAAFVSANTSRAVKMTAGAEP